MVRQRNHSGCRLAQCRDPLFYRFDETPGCYLWCSCTDGDGSYLAAEGEIIQGEIPQESNVGSRIDVIVDQDSSTVEFLLDGVPVGKGRKSCKLSMRQQDVVDLTPAVVVVEEKSALTFIGVSRGDATASVPS